MALMRQIILRNYLALTIFGKCEQYTITDVSHAVVNSCMLSIYSH